MLAKEAIDDQVRDMWGTEPPGRKVLPDVGKHLFHALFVEAIMLTVRNNIS